jgi:hypothetical protein
MVTLCYSVSIFFLYNFPTFQHGTLYVLVEAGTAGPSSRTGNFGRSLTRSTPTNDYNY